MNKRGAGVAFCFIASLLYISTRGLYDPSITKVLSVTSLIVGLTYLYISEFVDKSK